MSIVCKSCGAASEGNFCSNCGQKLQVNRLSLHELLHEAFHFFTHLDKGFFYTLKMLIIAPGRMQREFIEGARMRHQKPFSMFFISGTVCALIIYWISNALMKYFDSGDVEEAQFFHQYWVLMQVILMPLYALIVYLCFRKGGYNYGEVIVFELYNFSFLFLLLAVIHLLKFIDVHLETRYIELPLFTIYTLITNLNFFVKMKKLHVALISVVSITLIFLFASAVQDAIVNLLYSK